MGNAKSKGFAVHKGLSSAGLCDGRLASSDRAAAAAAAAAGDGENRPLDDSAWDPRSPQQPASKVRGKDGVAVARTPLGEIGFVDPRSPGFQNATDVRGLCGNVKRTPVAAGGKAGKAGKAGQRGGAGRRHPRAKRSIFHPGGQYASCK